MSYRVKGMGMDREIEMKTEQKYSLDDENEIVEWIVSVLMYGQGKQDFEDCDIEVPECQGKQAFQRWLSDGKILCQLMNVLDPGSCCKYQEASHVKFEAMRRSKEMNNIFIFLTSAEKYGVSKLDLFQVNVLIFWNKLKKLCVKNYITSSS
ncbi:unnamed protein product [Clavelina lepadiformis]|uniref:Calponin-homology (CH) domain-containing protein n=1 Tax=Clavelina lepadiformis TaxID=159417 RepID=A0ABP0FH09_CLALP